MVARPGFEKLVAALRTGEIGAVLCFDASRLEHLFAAQKRRFALVIRTVGQARATEKPMLANLAYNFTRFPRLESRRAAW